METERTYFDEILSRVAEMELEAKANEDDKKMRFNEFLIKEKRKLEKKFNELYEKAEKRKNEFNVSDDCDWSELEELIEMQDELSRISKGIYDINEALITLTKIKFGLQFQTIDFDLSDLEDEEDLEDTDFECDCDYCNCCDCCDDEGEDNEDEEDEEDEEDDEEEKELDANDFYIPEFNSSVFYPSLILEPLIILGPEIIREASLSVGVTEENNIILSYGQILLNTDFISDSYIEAIQKFVDQFEFPATLEVMLMFANPSKERFNITIENEAASEADIKAREYKGFCETSYFLEMKKDLERSDIENSVFEKTEKITSIFNNEIDNKEARKNYEILFKKLRECYPKAEFTKIDEIGSGY